MSAPKRRDKTSVSLFPFLAVLVCAMGALIFLLLVTTQGVRRDAVARAMAEKLDEEAAADAIAETPVIAEPPLAVVATATENEPAAAIPEPDVEPVEAPVDPNVRLRERIHVLARQLDDVNKLAEAEGARLLANRETSERLTARQADLVSTLEKVEKGRQSLSDAYAAHVLTHQKLEQQVPVAEGRLGRARAESTTTSGKYAFLPFDGRLGTTRRPILIECTGKGFHFLQEDVWITEDDIEDFTISFNPLLAGTKHLVRYWSSKDRQVDQTEPEPYVLLLVRPSGSAAFYAARKLLTNLRQPSGYELVPEDWQLAAPARDEDAARVCRAAIDETLAQRDRMEDSLAVDDGSASRGIRFRAGGRGLEVEQDVPTLLTVPGRTGRVPAPSGDDGAVVHSGLGRGGTGDPRQVLRQSSIDGLGATAGFPSSEDTVGQANRGTRAPNGKFADIPGGSGIEGESADGESGEFEQARHFSASGPSSRLEPGGSAGQSGGWLGSTEGSPQSNKLGAALRSVPSHPTHNSNADDAGQSGDGGSSYAPEGSQPLPSFGLTRSLNDTSPSPSEREKSRRWGLSSRGAGIGFERAVTIRVYADRVAVGNERAFAVGQGETRGELVDEAVTALERNARSWGKPPDNFYWVPAIRFVVMPGGNQHYERLNGAMKRFGLSTRIEFQFDTVEPPLKPE